MSSSHLRQLRKDDADALAPHVADAESSTGATRLYERVGMRVLRQSNTWERAL